ncbi:transcriptional regulator, AraC family [Filimonas lacunae]|uniref:Transcriptional regulator, AraC family n=1 Tax=Filimonas lacunae TaxID=477680 RepID=A0A173MGT7_9BACT|nr:AraC family transcriptional regulator [Filimonas lacunae]BAV06628.1 transcriptional regulator, AraC family [Filimonas lacunae]SIT27653.1 transcriptional regulator, AraC family [Filimonas lacunae]
MQKENLYEPFSIAFQTLDEGPKQAHKHNFFELVYIVSGSGVQCINKSQFRYTEGHMFLITPEDCHSFEVNTTTSFFFLRFNNIYLTEGGLPKENIQRLEFILQNANHQPGCILKNQVDKQLVRPMVDAMIREFVNRDIYNQELIQQLVNTLIIVVARNIAKYQPAAVTEQTEEKAMDILHYIQAHIYEPDKLRAENISQLFHISPAYLSRYFKQHTGDTMQQYIANYKMKLILHRLEHSDKRISEIAFEFNFTDESHFNKYFKKIKGASPREYRKQLLQTS